MNKTIMSHAKEITYKTIMRHAKKITKNNKKLKFNRYVLNGVKLYADGSLAFTDSHRLYFIKEAHDKEKDMIITPDGKELEGKYPNIDRLFPASIDYEIVAEVDELLKAMGLIHVGAKIMDDDYCMLWRGTKLTYKPKDVQLLTAEYDLPEEYHLKVAYTLSSNVSYWVDALKFIKDLGYREIKIEVHSMHSPIVLRSVQDDKLTVLIMPIRRS